MTMMSKNDLIKEIYDYVLDYDLDSVVFDTHGIHWLAGEAEWCLLWEDKDGQGWRIASLERCLDWVPEDQLIDWYEEYVAELEEAV